MNDQYYTPDIEDIRVGYECEANPKFYSTQEDIWRPTVMKGVGQEVIYYHSLGVYRTPYLTKEQIEAEGWIWKSEYSLFHKEVHISANIRYWYDIKRDANNIIKIEKTRVVESYLKGTTTTTTNMQISIAFEGECPSINEFRTITRKLLKIV